MWHFSRRHQLGRATRVILCIALLGTLACEGTAADKSPAVDSTDVDSADVDSAMTDAIPKSIDGPPIEPPPGNSVPARSAPAVEPAEPSAAPLKAPAPSMPRPQVRDSAPAPSPRGYCVATDKTVIRRSVTQAECFEICQSCSWESTARFLDSTDTLSSVVRRD